MLRLSDATWRKLPEWVLIAGVLACLAVVTWTVIDLWPHPNPIPPREQATADSLTATKPDYTRRRDALVKHETTYVAISRQNRAGNLATQRRADSLRAVAIAADSAARAARDTASRWFLSARAWHHTADTLAAANLRLETAYAAESTARLAAEARADDAERRRVAAEDDFAARLTRDLARASPPCRVLWLRCPSRRAVAVGSAALTLVAVAAAHSLSR